MPPRLHILGAGSIGCLFAHHLSAAGWPVTLLLRRAAAEAFAVAGSAVRCGGAAAKCSAEVLKEPGAAPSSSGGGGGSHIDHLLVTTKANQAAGALAPLAHRLSPASVVVLLHNGVLGVHLQLLGPAGPFAEPAARPQFLLGSTTHGAWRRAPFDVVWHPGAAVFGCPLADGSGASDRGSSAGAAAASSGGGGGGSPTAGAAAGSEAEELLRQLSSPELAALKIDALATPAQLHQQLLTKLLVNAAVNPLTALLHCRNGGLLANPAARGLMEAVVEECMAALGPPGAGGRGGGSGGAAGGMAGSGESSGSEAGGGGESSGAGREAWLHGSREELLARVEGVLAATAGNLNSMLQDVVKGAPTEVDYLNGYVVQQAAARGVDAPMNALLTQLIRAREAVPLELRTHEQLR